MRVPHPGNKGTVYQRRMYSNRWFPVSQDPVNQAHGRSTVLEDPGESPEIPRVTFFLYSNLLHNRHHYILLHQPIVCGCISSWCNPLVVWHCHHISIVRHSVQSRRSPSERSSVPIPVCLPRNCNPNPVRDPCSQVRLISHGIMVES